MIFHWNIQIETKQQWKTMLKGDVTLIHLKWKNYTYDSWPFLHDTNATDKWTYLISTYYLPFQLIIFPSALNKLNVIYLIKLSDFEKLKSALWLGGTSKCTVSSEFHNFNKVQLFCVPPTPECFKRNLAILQTTAHIHGMNWMK